MPNIKQVAKYAHVSVATVSRVLNNSGSVDPETRIIVENAIKELGYIPNQLARSLYHKKSNIIGLIVPHIATDYFATLIEEIEDKTMKLGYKLMIFNSKADVELEKKYIKFLKQYYLDGIILLGFTKSTHLYLEMDIPVLVIDNIIGDDTPSLCSDNFDGGCIAANKLIENGRKRIIHFRGPSTLLTVADRAKGFNSVLKHQKVKLWDIDLDFQTPSLELIESMIRKHPKVDGIFCSSDFIAMFVMRVLHKLGYRIPEDVDVIGFDNIPLSEIVIPSITTIAQDTNKIGETAINSLVLMINKQKLPVKHQYIPVKIIERESTKNLSE